MKTLLLIAIVALVGCGLPGVPGQTGPAGKDGTNGVDGANGIDGTNGANGINGTNGVDAAPVTMIQLCPGSVAAPGVFIEYGICLQGKLYGVYSANGGFLAYLPNGNYSSNGIGSSCGLTVNGCSITH